MIHAMKVMGSATAPAAARLGDRIGAIGASLEGAAMAAVLRSVRAAGGSNAEVKASALLRNSMEGSVELSASWFDPKRGRVEAKASAPVASGAVELGGIKAMLESAAPSAHVSPTSAKKTYLVDPAKLRAKRIGNVVALSHESLPEWGLQLSLDEIKASREGAEQRIAASIQGYCASMLFRNAEIPGGLKMPLVASQAPAAVPAQIEAPKPAEHPELDTERAAMSAGAPSSQAASVRIDASAGLSRKWEASEAILGTLRRAASDAALVFVRKSLAAGSPSVQSVDLTGLVVEASRIEGSAVVAVDFYGNKAREQATIEVPFDAAGRVVASGVTRTKADVAAAEDLRSKLEVASEAEAKAIFDKYVADQKLAAARDERLGIRATSEMGYGGNWAKRGPADRIPIEKHALPAEFSVVGKKILIGGLVYQLEPTDYNSVSFEKSAHWMLELRLDIPASKADYAIGFGGLGEALATAGL